MQRIAVGERAQIAVGSVQQVGQHIALRYLPELASCGITEQLVEAIPALIEQVEPVGLFAQLHCLLSHLVIQFQVTQYRTFLLVLFLTLGSQLLCVQKDSFECFLWLHLRLQQQVAFLLFHSLLL